MMLSVMVNQNFAQIFVAQFTNFSRQDAVAFLKNRVPSFKQPALRFPGIVRVGQDLLLFFDRAVANLEPDAQKPRANPLALLQAIIHRLNRFVVRLHRFRLDSLNARSLFVCLRNADAPKKQCRQFLSVLSSRG
jgi:hypothetical protein